MSAVLPWEITPVFREERLLALARIAVETRNKVFAEANRDEGDTNWGLGCRAHERLGHALSRLAEGDESGWLQVVREGLYLMPLIEGVPVRVYRGAPDKPGARHLDALRLEHERNRPSQMAFSFMGAAEAPEEPWFWLMALDTELEGRVLRAVFFQANQAGETRHAWEVPLDRLSLGGPVAVDDQRELVTAIPAQPAAATPTQPTPKPPVVRAPGTRMRRPRPAAAPASVTRQEPALFAMQ